MTILKAQIIKKNGEKEYAVLPYEEFLRVKEELQDYDDLRCLRKAKAAEKDASSTCIDELKKKIGEPTGRPARRGKARR